MTPRVSFVAIADRPQTLPVLIASLVAQTLPQWELLVLDQTPLGTCLPVVEMFFRAGEKRVQWQAVARHGDWGMTAKDECARSVARGEVLAFPNDDAYYCPIFLERLLAAMDDGAELVYCDWVFDKFNYTTLHVQPTVGHIDVGGFLVTRTAFVAAGGFATRTDTGDGALVERIVASGALHARVPGAYYVKN